MAISVAYYEMAGWPRELFFIDAFAGERKLICDWGDRTALATEIMLPGNNIYPYNNSGAFVSHVPKARPLVNGKELQGSLVHMASYVKAVVTVNYSTSGIVTGSTPTGALITEWTNTGSEFKTGGWAQKALEKLIRHGLLLKLTKVRAALINISPPRKITTCV